jgi:threonine dehydrogenase-like Zn-dependent dehydrogenase
MTVVRKYGRVSIIGDYCGLVSCRYPHCVLLVLLCVLVYLCMSTRYVLSCTRHSAFLLSHLHVTCTQTNHFPIGQIMMKHLTVRSGQCPCQKYFPEVMEKVQSGEVDPTLMITHRISLDEVRLCWYRCVNRLLYRCVHCTERGGW